MLTYCTRRLSPVSLESGLFFLFFELALLFASDRACAPIFSLVQCMDIYAKRL